MFPLRSACLQLLWTFHSWPKSQRSGHGHSWPVFYSGRGTGSLQSSWCQQSCRYPGSNILRTTFKMITLEMRIIETFCSLLRPCWLTALRRDRGGQEFTLSPFGAHTTCKTLSSTTRLKRCSPSTAKKVWIQQNVRQTWAGMGNGMLSSTFFSMSFLSSVLCSVGAPSTGAQGGVADRCNRSSGSIPQTLQFSDSVEWTGEALEHNGLPTVRHCFEMTLHYCCTSTICFLSLSCLPGLYFSSAL